MTLSHCFYGEEVSEFSKILMQDNVILGDEKNLYGYKFCPHVRQRFTDIGLCTTLEVDKVTFISMRIRIGQIESLK